MKKNRKPRGAVRIGKVRKVSRIAKGCIFVREVRETESAVKSAKKAGSNQPSAYLLTTFQIDQSDVVT